MSKILQSESKDLFPLLNKLKIKTEAFLIVNLKNR